MTNLVTSFLGFLFQPVNDSRAETPNVIKELFVLLNDCDGNILKLLANLDGPIGENLFHSGVPLGQALYDLSRFLKCEYFFRNAAATLV